MNKNTKIIIGIITGAILIFGLLLSISAKQFSNQGKYVEVKGLSERIIKADRAIWTMSFEVKSNDSSDLYRQIARQVDGVTAFLTDAGFESSEINTSPASTYQDTYQNAQYRYNARMSLSVYTDKIDLVKETSQQTLSLIEQGIVINDSYTNYEIADINQYKPEMLQEAIANARLSAEQFAYDSGARVGDIARANQGVFAISEKDPASPEMKKVRLVSTLRYLIN
ncbi:MAG: SIMPL domain-containing protein [Candidatus Pacebacteria bacterium]|nr:SIMPL domain-containing protein [Candidatus Paceibacterota bacterium]